MPNLVGIGNSQVPTNAMLGGLAYQDSVGEINLEKIKARTSDTAVDIFVYDTRKDSDGGAWRHRTQNTSWYNEGASATRGARKEFPSVAVVVAADGIYTIYDGDDPNLPMWMVFEHDASSGARIARQGTSAITMLNGLMCATRSGSQRAAGFASFIDDTGYQINNIGKYLAIGGWDGLVNRNVTGSFTGTDSSYAVAGNGTMYDVSMTVLPNAAINDATGLPIPTIAIAHNSGTSIITDSPTGVVYDLTANAEANDVAEIAFLADNRYSFSTTANNSRWWVDDIQTADENHNYFYQRTTYDYSQGSQGSISPLGRNNGTGRGEFGEAIFRQASGMSRVRYVDTLINYTTTDFNTGWMVGDIKGAYLADTDDTNLTTTNLVTNGDFSNGSTGWDLHGLTVNTSGNNMVMTSTNGNQRISQAITVEAGKRYHFILTSSGNRSHYVSTNTVSSGSLTNSNNSFFTVPAGTTTVYVVLYVIGTGNSATFDDIIVTKADADHSSNSRGLRVSGTVNKSPVATGAELVGYNFPSASDYLTYPYDTNIVDVGTGDFSVMGWFYNTPRGVNFIDIASAASPRFFVSQMYNSDNFWFYINTSSGAHGWTTGGTGIELKPYWQFIAVKRVGTTFSYSFNGKDFVNQTNSAWGGSISGGTPFITVGQIYTHNSDHFGTTGQMALWKFSHTAPSIEQIKKTYNDEKYLFRDNAKCTLYGTANNVTALAYDDTKNILHVGTNSGRSEFRGLNRINNTTTAVTTAISASNGLVAEQ